MAPGKAQALRFIHAADIHLDSPLRGLERYEGAPVDRIRDATRRALENLVRLALDENVDFVVLAGDIYDGDWRDFGTGLFFVREMARLHEAGIPVILIAGNHDAESTMSRSVPLPKNVITLGSKQPETHLLDDLEVAIHGQSFANKAESRNLVLDYPAAHPGYFNIGLLHTSLTGREHHDTYAPCTLADLQRLGYDYWALGHVHTREEVCANPPVHFPGNIQGRHIIETGARGCLLVEQDAEGTAARFVPLDVLRWERCVLDSEEDSCDPVAVFAAALDTVLEANPEMLVALRVEITGALALHPDCAEEESLEASLRATALAHGGENIWLEKVKVFRPQESAVLAVGEGPFAEVLAVLDDFAQSPEDLPAFQEIREKVAQKLPADLRNRPEIATLLGSESAVHFADESAALLRARLGMDGGSTHAD